jgi:hypothetical protein
MVVRRAPLVVSMLTGAVTVAALAGCGSDNATGPGAVRTDTLTELSAFTGTMVNAFGVTNFLGNWEIEVGDLDGSASGETERGVVTFGVGALFGDSARSAILRVDECAVTGTPFATLGNVVVDHIPAGAPPALAQNTGPALAELPDTVARDTTTGFKTADVTSAVEADLADTSTFSQFRLRFSVADANSNSRDDYVDFRTGTTNHCTGDPTRAPILIVTH